MNLKNGQTMETKQTAVDWLFEKITQNAEIRWRGTQYVELFQQAKAMEKEQIKESHLQGLYSEIKMRGEKQAEQYYNETYNKQDNGK